MNPSSASHDWMCGRARKSAHRAGFSGMLRGRIRIATTGPRRP
ncbi:hypothetical protein [Lysobacter gummosus]